MTGTSAYLWRTEEKNTTYIMQKIIRGYNVFILFCFEWENIGSELEN